MAETVVPMSVFTDTGWAMADRDEFLRPDTTLEGLAALSTPFRAAGRVTAGNSAGLTDGATAALLASERAVAELGLEPRLRLVSFAYAGVEPELMGLGPVPATRKALAQAGLSLDDIDLFEVNEPFAVQVLTWCRELGIDPEDERLNPYGGAIACGHPLAATGVRLVAQLAYAMRERPTPATASRRSASASAWAPRSCGNVPDTVFHLRPVETKAGRLALVTIDNGEDWTKPPSLGRSALASGQTLLEELESGDWVAAVFTGKPFWFCAGADINEFPQVTPETAGEGSRAGHELFLRIRALPFPTVAAINGACLGGGLELALHCSARTIASTVRHFGFPEVFLGLFPAWGGTQLTPRLVGPQAAIKLVVTNPLSQNRLLKAKDAVELGLAERLLEPVELVDESIAFALELVETPIERDEPDWSELETIMRRARTDVDDAVHGASPAPYRALDLIEGAATWTIEEGYRQEEAAIAELLPGNQAQAAIYAFGLVERRAKRKPDLGAEPRPVTQGRHRRRGADGEPAGDAFPPPPRGAGRAPRPRPGDRRSRAGGDPDRARRACRARPDDRGQGALPRLDRDRLERRTTASPTATSCWRPSSRRWT